MDVATMLTVFDAYGFEVDDEMTTDRQVEALNETYWDVMAREAWPFLQSSATLTFAGSTGLPSNDPGDINVVEAAMLVANGNVLQPWRRDDFYQQYSGYLTQAGSPQLYFFEGGHINFFPLPSSGDSVLLKYLKTAPALTATSAESAILLPVRYHRAVLVIGTLARLAIMQDDTEMGAAYDNLYERAINQMTGDLLLEQSDRTEFIHVYDDDNFDYS